MTPLSLQLKATAKVVAFVMKGRSLSDVLVDEQVVAPALRPAVQALSFSALRHWGFATALTRLLVAQQPQFAVQCLLATALALLQSEADSGALYTEFTLVNQTVEAAKSSRATQGGARFINAILRRYLRERPALDNQAGQSESARFNHPQWWINQLKQEQPSQWENTLLASHSKAPLSLRVNLLQTSQSHFTQQLEQQGIKFSTPALQVGTVSTPAVVLPNAVPIQSITGYQEGWFSVQDIAAQAASVQLLSDDFLHELVRRAAQGHLIRVLDACAAPGGKTTHLIERLMLAGREHRSLLAPLKKEDDYFEVFALEVDAQRAVRIHDNLSRLQLQACVKKGDARVPADWWDGTAFDAVLLDAPCSASGVVRRHPDIVWLRKPSDLAQLAQQQYELLQALWPLVREGGRLLYATCSIFQAEGAQIKERFLRDQPQAKALDSHGLWLPTSSPLPHDGFYDALFEKKII